MRKKEGDMTYTPQCLAWRLEWGPLRYSGERERGGGEWGFR